MYVTGPMTFSMEKTNGKLRPLLVTKDKAIADGTLSNGKVTAITITPGNPRKTLVMQMRT